MQAGPDKAQMVFETLQNAQDKITKNIMLEIVEFWEYFDYNRDEQSEKHCDIRIVNRKIEESSSIIARALAQRVFMNGENMELGKEQTDKQVGSAKAQKSFMGSAKAFKVARVTCNARRTTAIQAADRPMWWVHRPAQDSKEGQSVMHRV